MGQESSITKADRKLCARLLWKGFDSHDSVDKKTFSEPQGSEFKSLAWGWTHTCKPVAGYQPHSRVSERICPKGGRQRVTEKDTKSVDCRLLFEFIVKVGLTSHILQTQVYLHRHPPSLLSYVRLGLWLHNKEKRGNKSKENLCSGSSNRSALSNWHCCPQIPMVGKESWKFSHGKLIHADKAPLPQLPHSCSARWFYRSCYLPLFIVILERLTWGMGLLFHPDTDCLSGAAPVFSAGCLSSWFEDVFLSISFFSLSATQYSSVFAWYLLNEFTHSNYSYSKSFFGLHGTTANISW